METILENHNIYLYIQLDHRFSHYYIGQILPNSMTCRPRCALVPACYLQETIFLRVRLCNSRLCIALFLSPFLLHEKVSVAKYFFPLLYFCLIRTLCVVCLCVCVQERDGGGGERDRQIVNGAILVCSNGLNNFVCNVCENNQCLSIFLPKYQFPRRDRFKRSIAFSSALFWNTLPLNHRHATQLLRAKSS